MNRTLFILLALCVEVQSLAGQNISPCGVMTSTKVVFMSQYSAYNPSLKRAEYVATTDSTVLTDKSTLTANDSLPTSTSMLGIQTRPPGARVYIDSTFVGESPLNQEIKLPGQHTILCVLKDYRDFTTQFPVEKGLKQTLIAALTPSFGLLSLTTTPGDARMIVDSNQQATSPLTDVKFSPGIHTLSLTHPDFNSPIQGTFAIYPGYRTVIEAGGRRFDGGPLLASLIIPGFGQVLDHSTIKGSLEFLAAFGSACFAFNSYNNKLDKQNAYDLSKAEYMTAATPGDALIAHTKMANAASDLDQATNRATVSYCILGAAYAFSVIDALLFHTVKREITIMGNYHLSYNALMEYHRNGNFQLGAALKF